MAPPEKLKRVVIVMSTFQKVHKEFIYAAWMDIALKGHFERIIWIFSPGNSGVVENEWDVALAETT